MSFVRSGRRTDHRRKASARDHQAWRTLSPEERILAKNAFQTLLAASRLDFDPTRHKIVAAGGVQNAFHAATRLFISWLKKENPKTSPQKPTLFDRFLSSPQARSSLSIRQEWDRLSEMTEEQLNAPPPANKPIPYILQEYFQGAKQTNPTYTFRQFKRDMNSLLLKKWNDLPNGMDNFCLMWARGPERGRPLGSIAENFAHYVRTLANKGDQEAAKFCELFDDLSIITQFEDYYLKFLKELSESPYGQIFLPILQKNAASARTPQDLARTPFQRVCGQHFLFRQTNTDDKTGNSFLDFDEAGWEIKLAELSEENNFADAKKAWSANYQHVYQQLYSMLPLALQAIETFRKLESSLGKEFLDPRFSRHLIALENFIHGLQQHPLNEEALAHLSTATPANSSAPRPK